MKTNTNNSTTVISRWTRFFGAMLTVAFLVPAVAMSQPSHFGNPASINLKTAANFRILAASAVSIGIGDTVTGDVGEFPGTAYTENGKLIGTTYLADLAHVADTAQVHLTAAYDTLVARPPDTTIAVALDGKTFTRGVYAGPGTFSLNDTVTLNGGATDVFIFQTTGAGTTLITGTAGYVKLIGGAVWQNVFWQVQSSATIAGDFKGNILAQVSIDQSVDATSIITGRLLARNGAVTVAGHKVLPVELVAFTATANRMNADLHWSTATEVNNYGFEIERRQTAQWDKVGFVSGAGTSNSPRDYSYTDNNLPAGRYTYRLKQVDNNGAFSYHGSVEVGIGLAPQEFALSQNYPNPFNPSTKIQYSLANAAQVSLKVYNVLGLEVATLVNGRQEAGSYTVPFSANSGNTSTFASGVYFYRLEAHPKDGGQAGSFVSTKKLVLMK
jgi:hypothetical protein